MLSSPSTPRPCGFSSRAQMSYRHMRTHTRHFMRRLLKSQGPRTVEIRNIAQNQIILTSACWKEPLSIYFIRSLCLFYKLREVKWLPKDTQQVEDRVGDWKPSLPVLSQCFPIHPPPQNTSEPLPAPSQRAQTCSICRYNL